MSIDLDKFWLDKENTVLLVIDIQDKLVTAMPPKVYARMRATTAMLVEAASLLGIPVLTTEQYPKGIGHTVAELSAACAQGVIEKTSFGCGGEPAFLPHCNSWGAASSWSPAWRPTSASTRRCSACSPPATTCTWYAMPSVHATRTISAPGSATLLAPARWWSPPRSLCSNCSRIPVTSSSGRSRN